MAATAGTVISGPGYANGRTFTGVLDPTADNDLLNNYLVGDKFLNTVTGSVFACVDNTTATAVWRHIDVIQATLVYSASIGANVPFYVAPRACLVLAILNRVEVKGTGGALTAVINKAPSGTALSAGTALHTGSIDLVATTAATNGAAPTLAAASALAIPAGTAIGATITGTATSAVGCITVLMLPA